MKKVRQMAILTLLGCFSFAQLSFAASAVSTTTVNVVTLAKTPSNLTLDTEAATDTSLPLLWDANGNPSNTGYTLEMSEDQTDWTVVQDKGIDDMEETVTGLAGNKMHYFRVSSYNQDSPPGTNGEYLTGQFLTKPAKPPAPTGSVDGQTITVNWGNEPGTTTKLFDGKDQQLTIDDGDTNKTLADLTPDTAYEFYIVHSNTTGDSVPSDKVKIWTDAKDPANLRVTDSTETSLAIAIDANGNPSTTQYKYRITTIDGTAIDESDWTTDLTYNFSSLSPGRYKVYAKARNNTQNPNVKETAEIELVTGTVPAAPSVETVPTEDSITVTLTPNSDSTNVEFRIVLQDENGQEVAVTDWAQQGTGWAAFELTYTFTGLQPNRNYKVLGEARYAE
ncbi:fibronectin type III domain-containing protein [Brevibacillus agri]|uniref:Fibronectin type III domain-containing protein n=1 Tax=Brevibacillus brevis TaxID=1393 RepID=A0ABY9SZ40_BREBE|nr:MULTISPECIES: fibronectin type III domain-containing protein [Brevibacillus]MCG5254148.1 fibronectin type III domain-containing protein [Brevibacillus agri]MED4567985.1 fibronectin type III domain-containing protein [Brevibacillus agri]WNC13100.1 fibronectin type III domain-containing protein [Brevibacillus brevis]